MKGTGADIVLAVPPKGQFIGGYLSGVLKPGTQLTIKANIAPICGNFTWEAYETASGADGDPRVCAILCPDDLQGKSALDAYADGDFAPKIYFPLPGEYCNVLVAGQPGTGSANAFFIGTRLIPQHATGKQIAATLSTQLAQWQCLEHIDEIPNTDTLVFCMKQ